MKLTIAASKLLGRIPRKLRILLAMYVGILVVSFFLGQGAWWFFSRPIPRLGHARATPNWVHLVIGSSTCKEAPGLPQYTFEGMWFECHGSFEMLLPFNEIETNAVENIEIRDIELDTEVAVGVPLPANLTIRTEPQNLPGAYLKATAPQGGIYFRRFGTKDDNDCPVGKEHPRSKDYPSLFFALQQNHVLFMKFLERSVNTATLNGVPKEFAISAPLGVETGMPSQRLGEQKASTVIMRFFENKMKPSRDSIQLTLNATSLSVLADDVDLSLGRMTRSGRLFAHVSELQKMVVLDQPSGLNKPFSFALTPAEKTDDSGESSWAGVKGGVRYVFFSGPTCSLSLGNKKLNLDSTDRVEMVGDLLLNLDFEPGALPRLEIDGEVAGCRVNGMEMLPTQWSLISPNVRGGIVGGAVGFVLSLILNLLFLVNRKAKPQPDVSAAES